MRVTPEKLGKKVKFLQNVVETSEALRWGRMAIHAKEELWSLKRRLAERVQSAH